MKIQKFKDQCDQCKKFDFLKSYNGKCLCKNCLNNVIPSKKQKQLTLFELEVQNGN